MDSVSVTSSSTSTSKSTEKAKGPIPVEVLVDPSVEDEGDEGGRRKSEGEKMFITEEDDVVDGGHSRVTRTDGDKGDNKDKDDDDADGAAFSCAKGEKDDDDDERVNLELTKAFDNLSTSTKEEDSQGGSNSINGSHDEGGEGGGHSSSGLMERSLVESLISEDEEGAMSSLWKSQQRHILILSESGKPIFSRHGNEEKLVTLFGVLQALVSFVNDSDDSIRSIRVGETVIVFLLKTPLILVCVSHMGESVAQVQTHLMYLYNQIVSILTSKQLLNIFEKRRNYDLRRLLSGSERLLYNLCNLVESDPSFVLGAVRCLPLASTVRDTISQSISQTLGKLKQDVVFAILLANNQLVSLVRMKKCFMHPMDLHIIINFIDASESFKTAETWSPLCLPKFDSSGFVHAHVSYLTDECQACLVLLTVDRESFFALSEAKQKIVERLKRYNCLEAINASMNNNWPTMSFVNIPEIRHFLYKSRSMAQFMSPALEAPYVGSSSSEQMSTSSISNFSGGGGAPQYLPPDLSVELQRLYAKYYRMHSHLHAQSRPVKLLYWVDDTENWLAWLTSTFELYVTLEPLVKKSTAINAVNKLLKWVKKEEDRIFILNSPTF